MAVANGIDTLTHRSGSGGATLGHADNLLRPPPLPARCDPARGLVYLRFTLSYRDVEDLLAERGLEISNETIRRWLLKFGPVVARNLRRGRPVPHDQWHLDEMVVSIAGRRMYMWRAVGTKFFRVPFAPRIMMAFAAVLSENHIRTYWWCSPARIGIT